MRILPNGQMMPLHCCCDPALRLGWVPKPKRAEPGPVVFVAGHTSMDMVTGEVHYPERIFTEVAYLVNDYTPSGRGRLAVKSNDVPIETWRKVPGFIEDRRRT